MATEKATTHHQHSSPELIMEKLTKFSKPFPEKWVLEAVAARQEITPLLRDALKHTIDNHDTIDDDYYAHLYALYLLSQFRDHETYYLTLKLVELPGEVLERLLGDCITEGLSKFLASTFDGNIEPLLAIIKNKNINLYARDAGINALAILYSPQIKMRVF